MTAMQWTFLLLTLMGQCCSITGQLYKYHFIEAKKTWTDAQKYCREKYSDLATVSNMTDMKRINESADRINETWIGLYNQTKGVRKWYWTLPGVEFNENKTNWDKMQNEPNDNGIENCGFINKDLMWGDISCIRDATNILFLCYNESETSEKFYLIREKMNWLEAQSYCRQKHTDLISGLKQLRDDKLKEVIQNMNNDDYPFIGLFRDTWRWSDGSSFSFRFWHLQFNDEKDLKDQCAVSVFTDEGRWKTEFCSETKSFICYEDKTILITKNKTWEDALYYCRVHHHDLVTITSLDEQRWVQEKTKNALSPFVWTGLRYTCTLDLWFWVSDEVVSYRNWVSDGPMDECDMSGAMETGGQHQWFKRNDSEKFNFICSK